MSAASVNRPMRRTIFLALLATLLLVPTASAASPTQILRDCFDDGILQGNYTIAELRKAETQLPTDVDEYSDCRDVLSREIAARAAAASPKSDTGNSGAGAAAGTGGGGGGPSAPTPAATNAPSASTGKDPGTVTGPSTPEDWKAVSGAIDHGNEPLIIGGRPVSPGSSRLAAQVGRNPLPGDLSIVLALLGAVTLAAFVVPVVRRRGFTHREA